MAQLLKAASTAGTITVDRGDDGRVMVTIKGSKQRMFSADKVTSVDVSGFFLRTTTIHLLGGENVELKNMVQGEAEALQRLLS